MSFLLSVFASSHRPGCIRPVCWLTLGWLVLLPACSSVDSSPDVAAGDAVSGTDADKRDAYDREDGGADITDSYDSEDGGADITDSYDSEDGGADITDSYDSEDGGADTTDSYDSEDGGDIHEEIPPDTCDPATCEDLEIECGKVDDGCGTMLECGECGPHAECQGGLCMPVFGWDPGLTRRCLTTTGSPGDENYFEVLTDCIDGDLSKGQYLVAVESENGPGWSCPGPINRSLLINDPEGPVSLDFVESSSTLSVDMKVDQNTYFDQVCGEDYFTWFAFIEHGQVNGGPFPPARSLITHHVINFAQWTPYQTDATRVTLGAEFFWDGITHMVDVFISSSNWGDAVPDDPCVRFAQRWTDDLEYVSVDGSCFGLTSDSSLRPFTRSQDVVLDAHWGALLDYCINNAYLTAPSNWVQTAVQDVFLAIEVKGHAVAELWHRDFRILSEQSR